MVKAKRFMAGGLSDMLGTGPQTQTPAQPNVAVNVGAQDAAGSLGTAYSQDFQAQQGAPMKKGGKVCGMKKGGAVKARGCGCAERGLTKGKMV